MDEKSIKMSYGKVAVNLLIISILYVVLLVVAIVVLGAALTTAYNILTPYARPSIIVLTVLLQFLFSLTIIFFALGALSARMNGAYVKKGGAALKIGVLTGFSVNLLPWLISLFFIVIVYHLGISHFFYNGMFWMYFLILCLIISLFSAPFMAIGSYCHVRSTVKANINQSVKRIPKYAIGMVIALTLVLLVPVFSVFILYSQGTIVHSGVPQFSTCRLDNNTITITFDGYRPEHHYGNALLFIIGENWGIPRMIDMGKSYDLQILVNGKGASNTGAIVQSGLNASISPESGLELVKGSSVTITGSDILPVDNNFGYSGSRIEILGDTEGGSSLVIGEIFVR